MPRRPDKPNLSDRTIKQALREAMAVDEYAPASRIKALAFHALSKHARTDEERENLSGRLSRIWTEMEPVLGGL